MKAFYHCIVTSILASTVILSACSVNKIFNTTPSQNIPYYPNATALSDCEKSVAKCEFDIATSLADGKMFSFSMPVHGSVGFTLDFSMSKPSTLKAEQSFKYDKPARSQMLGGDAGVKTFYFKPIEQGKVDVIITQGFRGEVKREIIYHFDVK